jgi:hypothetical protein
MLNQVQTHDIKSVNEALNGIYIEEEDYEKLNKSVNVCVCVFVCIYIDNVCIHIV